MLDSAGNLLGRILMEEQTANVAWGDPDWKSMYITSSTSVHRLRLNIPGVPVGPVRYERCPWRPLPPIPGALAGRALYL